MRLSEGNPLEPVQILKHTSQNSTEQTAMRTKWFKSIAICDAADLLEAPKPRTIRQKLKSD